MAEIELGRSEGFSTIGDVAARAGVSAATVSRVLSGKGYVAAATRERVEASIAFLNFQPSLIAQSLRRQRTTVVGLVVTDIQNPFYPELVRGIEDSAQTLNYSIILCNSSNDPERERSYIDYLMSQRVDGVIVGSSGFLKRNKESLLRMRTRIVAVDTELPEPEIVSVCNDAFNGGKMAGQHLKEKGYEHIYYLGSKAVRESQRALGVQAGAGAVPFTYVTCDISLEAGMKAARDLAGRVKGHYAIAGHNDLVAIGALHGVVQSGIKVPDQVGVLGFDDIAMSAYVTPPLTTVRQHQYEMGVEAMNAMEHLIDYREFPKATTVASELIVRQSTKS